MTDLEKWKKFLDEMKIKYVESEDVSLTFNDDYTDYTEEQVINLLIDYSHMSTCTYLAGLNIVFNKNDNSFRNFCPSGE